MAENDTERAQALADSMTESPRGGWIDEATVAEQAGGEGGVDVVLDARHVGVVERPLGEHGGVRDALAERIGRSSGCAQRPLQSGTRHQFEGADRTGVTVLERGEQLDHAARVVDGEPPCLGRPRQGDEVDDGTRDDAERAAGPDGELRRVEAAAVLAQGEA